MLGKLIKFALVGLAVLVVVAAAFWHFYFKPGLLVEKARYGHMQWLGTAVIEFNTRYKRMPRSLDELVVSGLLPRESEMYANPMKRGSFHSPPLSYKDCEFELSFGSRTVTISIPKETFLASRYAAVRGSWRTWTVTDDLRLYDPKKDKL
jgi:hypothetical protein